MRLIFKSLTFLFLLSCVYLLKFIKEYYKKWKYDIECNAKRCMTLNYKQIIVATKTATFLEFLAMFLSSRLRLHAGRLKTLILD